MSNGKQQASVSFKESKNEKLAYVLGVALLAGCSAVQSPVTQEEVTLTPPSKIEWGMFD